MNRNSFLRELERLRQQLDELLERTLVAAELGSGEEGAAGVAAGVPGSWSPAVDLFETPDAYCLTAEVPGVERGDLDLEVEGRRLVLTGRRRPPSPSPGGNFHRMERDHGPFKRVFELDQEPDGGAIEAKLEHGILSIRVPKTSKGPRLVEVTDA